ncbi:cytochrome P450 [Nocardioides sp.]|uniref:cytochrome P450 n=1 Tax=Nocardioides sp. TaxID=35761 RepID=UPI0027346F19|nr:cytochrome P450 [Nocardioides sp.]MDP3891869.1 cytochrome P450 [Nocardioides sp.]
MPRDSTPRSLLHWSIAFGLPRRVIGRAARRGDLIARLEVEPGLRRDPFAAYDRIRADGPIVRGSVVSATARHAVANRILRGADFGVAGGDGGLPPLLRRAVAASLDPWAAGPIDPPSLLALDPPEHERYRRLVSRVFTPRSVARMEPRMREVADRLLDRIEKSGRQGFDLIEDYASLLPVAVIADILGVPDDMHGPLLAWGNGAALRLDPALTWREYRRSERDLRAMHTWIDGHIRHLRAHPGDDLLSRLVHLDGEERLTDLELRATGLLLLGAGFETTVNLIGNAVAVLSEHPDQRAVLREEPELWGNAVEEVLRLESPVQLTLRVAGADGEIDGARVRQGHAVLVLLGGVNRDPEVFEDPARFDVRRANAAEHLAFSAGGHFCLGAGLARLEATVALRALYERFPDLTPAGAPTRRPTRVLRGFERQPVTRSPHGTRQPVEEGDEQRLTHRG